MRRPHPSLRAVLAAMQEREGKRCKRCRKVVRGVRIYDVDAGGSRVGPYHQRCAPTFRDRIETK